jgi:hypothetical protein
VNDEDLLQALGELARERERDTMRRPDVWSRLAHGELSARELGELEARAATEPPIELSLRAYRPLSNETRDRIFDALSATLPARAEAALPGRAKAALPGRAEAALAGVVEAALVERAVAALAETSAEPAAPTPPAAAPAEVVSLDARRRLLRIVTPLTGVLMAAAALWVLVVRPPDQATQNDLAPLPSYEITARGGLKSTRGADDAKPKGGVLRLAPGSELDLALRPATKVEGPLALRAFVAQGGEVRPLTVPVEAAPTGALRVRGPVNELFAGLKGQVELRFVIGRAEALGEGTKARAKAVSAEGSGPGWQTLHYTVELVDAP